MIRRITILAALLAVACGAWAAPAATAQSGPGQGPGGPILVVTNDAFGGYYAEILRAEGLNEFAVSSLGSVSAQTLATYQVVVLAETTLSGGQAAMFSGWVQSGGDLIAMRPDPDLAGLLGLSAPAGTVANGYVDVDESRPPGAGIVGVTMQFHGTADRWTLAGARQVASLHQTSNGGPLGPAVTTRSVGSAGGSASVFTYDLARSVVQTRQGNPAWLGLERDGELPRRANDLFFGGAEADWVDPAKVHIPQADEQQRLLANLITQMSADRTPLPRFWYLPDRLRAAVVMTGDDHGRPTPGGSKEQFDAFTAASPPGCSITDWTCVRGTTYIYPTVPLDNAAGYQALGNEVALHFKTPGSGDCSNATDAALRAAWGSQLTAFENAFNGVAAPVTNRTHCIAWSGWVNDAIIERENGIRFDTNYYYWPGDWMQAPGQDFPRPGLFTGSGFPMRFADAGGSPIDVYQATTQITDEWGNPQRDAVGVATAIAALLDRAENDGFYGVFTANMHTDEMNTPHPGASSIIWAAQQNGVPVVSARQMLTWLDGRDGSSFQAVRHSGGRLEFGINVAPGARGLIAMVPANGPTGRLQGVLRDGVGVDSVLQTIKGVEYATFPAASGAYVGIYPGGTGSGDPPPEVDPPGVDPPGVDPPGVDPPGVNPPGVNPPGVDPSPALDRMKPIVVVRRTKLRAGGDGEITLKIACPRSELRCRIDVTLRDAKRTQLARTRAVAAGGKTVNVRLHLPRAARKALVRRGVLALNVRLVARDAAGNKRESTTNIRVLAPRGR